MSTIKYIVNEHNKNRNIIDKILLKNKLKVSDKDLFIGYNTKNKPIIIDEKEINTHVSITGEIDRIKEFYSTIIIQLIEKNEPFCFINNIFDKKEIKQLVDFHVSRNKYPLKINYDSYYIKDLCLNLNESYIYDLEYKTILSCFKLFCEDVDFDEISIKNEIENIKENSQTTNFKIIYGTIRNTLTKIINSNIDNKNNNIKFNSRHRFSILYPYINKELFGYMIESTSGAFWAQARAFNLLLFVSFASEIKDNYFLNLILNSYSIDEKSKLKKL